MAWADFDGKPYTREQFAAHVASGAMERLEAFRHHAPQHGGADIGAMGRVRAGA